VLTNEKDVATFKDVVALQHRLGVNTEWWRGDDVRKRLPMMRWDDALAATFNPKDGLVDPNGVVMGYTQRARQLGAQTLTDVEVTGIRVEGGKVVGVDTNRGSIDAPIVVNAAGPWAGLVGKMAGVDIPIEPLRRQWLTTTPIPDLPADFPFVIDFAQSLYFHPEGKGLLTGMSNPNEKPGFDQSVDPDWELVHMEAAIERFPRLVHAGAVSRVAGLYEVTPDAHPIFGKTPVEGFFVCAGFSGHGFMHGPVAGKLITEIILDGQAQTVDVAALDLARFSEGRLIEEYNVV